MTHLDADTLLELTLADLSRGTADGNLSPEPSYPDLSPGPADTNLSPGPADPAAHLAACADCRAALSDAREALHLLAFGPPPLAPSAALRVRLLAAVAGPLVGHSARVAEFLDLPHQGITAMLAAIDADTAAWTPVLPGIDLHALDSTTRERGLLRVAAGTTFPHHRHRGDERVLVLQGSCRDSSGRHLGPGDEIHHTRSTTHHLEIHPGPTLVFAYVSDGSDFLPSPI